MKKLINIQFMKAENVICVWREDENNHPFQSGIALKTALGNYMIPKYIAVCMFDDGTAKAIGVMSLTYFNETLELDDNYEEFCLYDQFAHTIDKNDAEAFVRGLIHVGEYDDEKTAKVGILADMERAGVKITDEARSYLGGRIDILLDRDIKDCFWGKIRVLNSLYGAGIRTLRDLVRHSPSELLCIRNLGKKSLNAIIDYLDEHNLELRMNV